MNKSDWFDTEQKLLAYIQHSGLTVSQVKTMIDNASQFGHLQGEQVDVIQDASEFSFKDGGTFKDDTRYKMIQSSSGRMFYNVTSAEREFIESFETLQEDIHQTALAKGWYGPRGTEERNIGEVIALTHSELSEALEAIRNGNEPDKHLPDRNSFDVELADAVIRIMDTCERMNIPLAEIIVEKNNFNKTRPPKHGKCF